MDSGPARPDPPDLVKKIIRSDHPIRPMRDSSLWGVPHRLCCTARSKRYGADHYIRHSTMLNGLRVGIMRFSFKSAARRSFSNSVAVRSQPPNDASMFRSINLLGSGTFAGAI